MVILTFLTVLCGCNRNPQRFDSSDISPQAVEKVSKAAGLGDPDAQYTLGYMYYYGNGVPQNYKTSVQWMDRAASQGQPQAVKALRLIARAGIKSKPEHPDSGLASNQNELLKGYKVSGQKAMSVPVATVKGASSASSYGLLYGVHAPGLSYLTPSQRKLLGANGKYYVLQLMASYSESRLLKLKASPALKTAAIFKVERDGKRWFVLLYGNFTSLKGAKHAVKKLPRSIQNLEPWPRTVTSVLRIMIPYKHATLTHYGTNQQVT